MKQHIATYLENISISELNNSKLIFMGTGFWGFGPQNPKTPKPQNPYPLKYAIERCISALLPNLLE